MSCTQRFRKGVGKLTLMFAVVLGCSVPPASAQTSPEEAAPFQSEWVLISGVGGSLGRLQRAGREQVFYAIEWGRLVSGEHGPGVLRGRLEMMLELTPVFLAFQSNRAAGVGFSPLMFRWNLRERGPIQPFLELAGGFVVTNHDMPEETSRLNFSSHLGAGARVRVAERWGVVAGYRLQHISNGNTAARNPGINSNVGYLGLAYRR